jgi:hypothetical protein
MNSLIGAGSGFVITTLDSGDFWPMSELRLRHTVPVPDLMARKI